MGPCGQHRGLGDAAPREGEQDPGPTGTRVTGFSSASSAARQSPSPASLPAAPHPLCTRLSVSGQTASRQNTEHLPRPGANQRRGASEKQTRPPGPGEAAPQTPPGTDGAEQPGGGRAPDHSTDRPARALPLASASGAGCLLQPPRPVQPFSRSAEWVPGAPEFDKPTAREEPPPGCCLPRFPPTRNL